MPEVFLSLGSNIGNREDNILDAVKYLYKIPEVEIIKSSSLYETEPVGFKEQEYFYNIFLKIYTELSPFTLLRRTKEIENKMGKSIKRRWGPRIIDIDILYYNNKIIRERELIVPHPSINKRRFILIPMAEIASEFYCPFTKSKISDIIQRCKSTESVIKLKSRENLIL